MRQTHSLADGSSGMDFLTFLKKQGDLVISSGNGLRTPLYAQPGFVERSATLFSADLPTWAGFLKNKYEPPTTPVFSANLSLSAGFHFSWEGISPMAQAWKPWLEVSFSEMKRRAGNSKIAGQILNDIAEVRERDNLGGIRIFSEPELPCLAVRWSRQDAPAHSAILLNPALLFEVEAGIRRLHTAGTPGDYLGVLWAFWRRVLLLVSYPARPRDRFQERIRHTLETAVLTLHLLHKEERERGMPVPNRAGHRWLEVEKKLPREIAGDVVVPGGFEDMVGELSFLGGRHISKTDLRSGEVIARDYLDPLYLRLSIADLMPSAPDWLRSLERPKTANPGASPPPVPPVGKCGIFDEEDQEAWKKLRVPLLEMGFYLLGQLGMGQFGRVYRAWNFARQNMPQVVAIKVDRIRRKHKQEAIAAAETIMETARSLSQSPHVIRVFDAGKIRKKNWTFHVLQLVEGDTLDNLIGVTGMEHASILRPSHRHSSEVDVRDQIHKAVFGSAGEAWRRARLSSEFLYPPSLLQTLDIMTSKSLWIEEVHALGFAVNDLKNGNVMINHRGQFKGIDLDSYAPADGPLDKLPDFFFLAISTFHLVAQQCKHPSKNDRDHMSKLLADPEAMERFLLEFWPWRGGCETDGTTGEIRRSIVRYIDLCRTGAFAREPDLFRQMIDGLIDLKREMSNEDLFIE